MTEAKSQFGIDVKNYGVDGTLREGAGVRRDRQLRPWARLCAVVIARSPAAPTPPNPSVMMAAGMPAKNAVEKGLVRKPWVKTSMALGRRSSAATTRQLACGLHLASASTFVGYGCATASAWPTPPPPEEVSGGRPGGQRLTAARGSRPATVQLRRRINPDVKMQNYPRRRRSSSSPTPWPPDDGL